MELLVKRVHAEPDAADGRRVLVDRLWPRGVSKERAQLDAWVRAVAPSDELRRWFGHDPELWEEFERRYHAELAANVHGVAELHDALAGADVVTLLFGTREVRFNNAVALRSYLLGDGQTRRSVSG